ncbi:MAG: metallophosphoesterase family protein [Armatimonadota bacterium]|nr:metallophosphoesterase family protein [Armatimonadota bacterium]
MRYAVLSDVHANLEALEVVLADLTARRPDAVLCLGDFVGYGPDPVACVTRLRPLLRGAVLGNHDAAVVDPQDTLAARFNPYAYEAALWTRRQLTDAVRSYLQGLPHRLTLDGILCVHGSARDPIEEYILDPETARASFRAAPFELCLVGHTHIPAVFTEAGEAVTAEPLLPGRPVRLRPDRRYIINVGSVGQPRDGDPRAAYLWLDTDAREALVVRLAYPLARTQQKMRAAGLPPILAERLAYGR